jgi:hypothetical protein
MNSVFLGTIMGDLQFMFRPLLQSGLLIPTLYWTTSMKDLFGVSFGRSCTSSSNREVVVYFLRYFDVVMLNTMTSEWSTVTRPLPLTASNDNVHS